MPTIEEHGGYYCAGCKQSEHGSAFALSFITEHPQPCAALIAKERRAAGSLGTFIAPTLLVGSSSGCLLSRQVQAYYSASFAA